MKQVSVLVLSALLLTACRNACCPSQPAETAARPEVAETPVPPEKAKRLPGFDRITVGGETIDVPRTVGRESRPMVMCTTSMKLRGDTVVATLDGLDGDIDTLQITLYRTPRGGVEEAASIVSTNRQDVPDGGKRRSVEGEGVSKGTGPLSITSTSRGVGSSGSTVRAGFEALDADGEWIYRSSRTLTLP